MVDEKKGLNAATIVRGNEPVSPLGSIVSSCRDIYRNGHGTARMGDAISMVTVVLVGLIVLMFLAVASNSGVSVFITGICVGALAGILCWSYDQYGRSGRDTSRHA